jgi:hypothetical protein
MSDSIIFDGRELTAGDWMHIPKGVRYSFKVGPKGATINVAVAEGLTSGTGCQIPLHSSTDIARHKVFPGLFERIVKLSES